MKVEFKQEQNDYLQHMLYNASHSVQAKKQRKRSWVIVTGLMLLTGLIFFEANNKAMSIYFLSFGVVSLLLYPRYQRVQYKKHFLKSINETYANRFGQTAVYHFNETEVETESLGAKSSIAYETFEAFNEIGDYWFLKLKSGGSLILPKKVLTDADAFKLLLTQKAQTNQVAMNVELDWKWK